MHLCSSSMHLQESILKKAQKEISNQTFEFQKAEMYSKTVFSKLLLNNYNKGAVFLLDLLQ